MKRFFAALSLSAALASLLMSILFLALAVGLVPDPEGAILDGRKIFCEAMAVHYARAVQRDELEAIRATAEVVVQRHPDLLSAGLRTSDGRLVVEIGKHEANWSLPDGEVSTPTQMVVPLILREKGFDGEERWGLVEFRFRPPSPTGTLASLGHPALPLIIFLVGGGFLAWTAYLWLTSRFLDARQPKVVPERVRTTLNTIVEGVLVLDRDQKIILANEAFAKILGQSVAELQGRTASDLPWADPQEKGPPTGYPWVPTMEQAVSLKGIVLGLTTAAAGLCRVSINATPILGDNGACCGALVTIDDLTAVERNNAQLKLLLRRLTVSRRKIHRQNQELKAGAARVKQLQGLLPICSYCLRIRDDKNYWQRVEAYITARTDAKFTHGICPTCFDKVCKPQIEQLTA